MTSVLTAALAVLMLLGIYSGTAASTSTTTNATVTTTGDGGPIPK